MMMRGYMWICVVGLVLVAKVDCARPANALTKLADRLEKLETAWDSLKSENDLLKSEKVDLKTQLTDQQKELELLKTKEPTKGKKGGEKEITVADIKPQRPIHNKYLGQYAGEFTCPLNATGSCIEGLYPNIYDCKSYWSCSLSGSECDPWLIYCPEPLEFSEVERTCVEPENSGCTEVTTPAPIGTTEEPYPCPPSSCYDTIHVAFFARADDGFSGTGPIVFPTVLLNDGDAYDVHNGQFKAPVSGVYVISASFLSDDSCGTDYSGIYIAVNGGVVIDFHGFYNTASGDASAAATLTLALAANDIVTAELHGNCAILHDTLISNSFSGHLVYAY